MTNEMSSVSENNNLSRRTLFKASGVTAAAVGGSGLLAACGGGSSGGSGSGGSGGSGGTLIYESTGGSIESEPGDQPRIELKFVGEAI